MTDPFVNGPHAARPALLPPVWPPLDPETGQFDLSDDSDPPDGFFTDPDIARRLSEATTIAQGLSPAEAMRDSNDKLSELTRAQWDFDVRRRAFEEAQAFSFTDPVDGAEPVFAEFSPEDAEKVDRFTGETGAPGGLPAGAWRLFRGGPRPGGRPGDRRLPQRAGARPRRQRPGLGHDRSRSRNPRSDARSRRGGGLVLGHPEQRAAESTRSSA